jgi:hypothetical protein
MGITSSTWRAIAASAIKSRQSNATVVPSTSIEIAREIGIGGKDVTISDLSFKVDPTTEVEIEEKRSEIRDLLGVGPAASTSNALEAAHQVASTSNAALKAAYEDAIKAAISSEAFKSAISSDAIKSVISSDAIKSAYEDAIEAVISSDAFKSATVDVIKASSGSAAIKAS